MTDRTRCARLTVRAWLSITRWAERKLCAAYDRLVDHESDWPS